MKHDQSNLLERVAETLEDVIRYWGCGHCDSGGYNDCCTCEARRLIAEIRSRPAVGVES